MGDYAQRLATALRELDIHVVLVTSGDWRLVRVPSLVALTRRTNADIIHIQYPTAGFGHKLGPQGVGIAVPGVVTIHEASKAHVIRKLALYPFAVRPKHIIFTSNEEREFATRWAPWIAEKSSVIAVGSNVDGVPSPPYREIREIVHFGLVMPRKGLEDVLALAALFKRNHQDLRVRVVGNCRPKDATYGADFLRKSEGLPLLWEQDLCETEVGRRLSGSWIAYLPFPDGASERRTTLKAALSNGMAVITTRGPDTSPDFEPVVRFCSSPSGALAIIRELIANPGQVEILGNRARLYAGRYSWGMIAQKHLAIYQKLVSRTPNLLRDKVQGQASI